MTIGRCFTAFLAILLACEQSLARGSWHAEDRYNPQHISRGTALGDWIADTGGLGYEGGAIIFGVGLALLASLYFWTNVSRVLLFWAAFILTRPLGATLGDLLDKSTSQSGLALSRPLASAAIAIFIVLCIAMEPQRAGRHPSVAEA
jgi:uncharacterized membrane-anchored protein